MDKFQKLLEMLIGSKGNQPLNKQQYLDDAMRNKRSGAINVNDAALSNASTFKWGSGPEQSYAESLLATDPLKSSPTYQWDNTTAQNLEKAGTNKYGNDLNTITGNLLGLKNKLTGDVLGGSNPMSILEDVRNTYNDPNRGILSKLASISTAPSRALVRSVAGKVTPDIKVPSSAIGNDVKQRIVQAVKSGYKMSEVADWYKKNSPEVYSMIKGNKELADELANMANM